MANAFDGAIDDCDGCPSDTAKLSPGVCGCGVADVDADADTIADCHDQCPGQDDRVDDNQNATPDCLEIIDVPIVSVWGITFLALILLVPAKLRFRYRHDRPAYPAD